MKVLFVSGEVSPFFRTGGLGEVAGSLPEALKGLGADVRVVMPLYREVAEEFRCKMKEVATFEVQLSWRKQYCGVLELEWEGVPHYFIDNEYYFKRPFAYGQFDDAERFAFFCKAVVDMLPQIKFMPDVIHCNDWQTGLIPVYLQMRKKADKGYMKTRSVFTIHNIEYQGKYDRALLGDVFGVPQDMAGVPDYDGGLNLLKGAVVASDRVTTVSPTYAKEILTGEYAQGLDSILRDNQGKLYGILNGIDRKSYDPSADEALFANYSTDDLEGKAKDKAHLQKMLGLSENPDVPMVGIVSRLVDHKGIGIVASAMEEILSESLQFVMLGTGDWKYEQMFLENSRKYPGKVSANIVFSGDLSRKIYAACDLFLMPSKSEPCGLAQMIALRYGTLPIVRQTGGLTDTIQNVSDDGATGNGFVFGPFGRADMLWALRRALGFYANKEVWPKLVKRAMECDFRWERSAGEYLDIYKSLAGK
jgi:starch synthase